MKKSILVSAALLFVLSLNIYFRSFPINFPQFKIQAEQNVNSKIIQSSKKEIEQKFSGYSGIAKGQLSVLAMQEYKKQHVKQVKDDIDKEYDKLIDPFQDAFGQTYLMELDCWHWARYVDNVLRFGRPADEVINRKGRDTYMMFPLGYDLEWNNFLFYSSAFLYKAFSLIKTVPLYTFLFYLPLFYITLLVIALFFFCLRFYGLFSAVISCLFVGLAPIFLPRSYVGWFDMDTLSLLLSFLAVGFYLTFYEKEASFKRYIFILLSGFLIGLYCFTWAGWWSAFFIIILYEVFSWFNEISGYFQYQADNLDVLKQHILNFLIFVAFSCFWIIIFCGFEPFTHLFGEVKRVLSLNKNLTENVWPNVFSTVSELRKADFLKIMEVIGGKALFISSCISMFILILSCKRFNGVKRESIFAWVLWFMVMFVACTNGIRFVMFLLIPLGICLGWFIDELWDFCKKQNIKFLKFIPLGLFFLVSALIINNGNAVGKVLRPLMDDNWFSVLTTIKEETSPKAVINSWWDFGDWFKVVADRRVIFDGQSQNTAQAYWMAKVLITNSESEALSILRMLNNGGNQVYELVNSQFKDPLKSILFIKNILGKKEDESRVILSRVFHPLLADKITKLLYDKPQEAYFIVDASMISKIPAISYLGNWDFTKAYLAKNPLTKDTSEYLLRLGFTPVQIDILTKEASMLSEDEKESWVSSRLRFLGSLLEGREQKDSVLFDGGLVYYPKDKLIYGYSSRDMKYKKPISLLVAQKEGIREYKYPDSQTDYSVLLFQDKFGYRALNLDSELAASMFVRMFFLNGKGLKHFELFTKEKIGQDGILVYKILWDAKKEKKK